MNELSQDGREATLSAARYAGMALPTKPMLAPWLMAVELGDARLQLRSAESSNTLTHPLLVQLFRRVEPLLDGRHTVDEIVSSVESDVLPTTVVFLLKLLQGNGLLQPGAGETTLDEGEQAHWRRQLRFLGHFVPDASSAQSRLAKLRVGLAGSGDLRRLVQSTIGTIGLRGIKGLREPLTWGTEAGGALASLDLIVACEDSPGFAFFDAVNRACLASGTRWLRVCVYGTSTHLGPTVIPHQTACYTCLDLRMRTHESELDGYLSYRARAGSVDGRSDEGGVAPLWSAVAGQVAMEVMRLLIGFTPPVTIGRFYELSAKSPSAAPHSVLRVPRCPSCGRRRTVAEAWDRSFMPADLEL